MVQVDDCYSIEKDCEYRGEHYSVRDNGAIMRYPKELGRIRPLDMVWTFGKVSNEGYLHFGNEAVHRIVATAFHGPAPGEKYVVDHIDTNRQNNRPDNLRWLTQLENILNNPITISKIISICGSVENFLSDPSQLRSNKSNVSWMRAVTPEEARNALDNLIALSNFRAKWNSHNKYEQWAEHQFKDKIRILNLAQRNTLSVLSLESRCKYVDAHGYEDVHNIESFGLITKENRRLIRKNIKNDLKKYYPQESKNSNAMQLRFWEMLDFTLCPESSGEKPLLSYYQAISHESIFCSSEHYTFITCRAIKNEAINTLFVSCKVNHTSEASAYCLVAVRYLFDSFIHEFFTFYYDYKSVESALDIASKFNGSETDIFSAKTENEEINHCSSSSLSIIEKWSEFVNCQINLPRLQRVLADNVHLTEYYSLDAVDFLTIYVSSIQQKQWIEEKNLKDLQKRFQIFSGVDSIKISVNIVCTE